MLRVIVRETNVGAAANVGGPVTTKVKTFDIDAPALEAHLREKLDEYISREAIGVEILNATERETP
jgi:hypothetical protein